MCEVVCECVGTVCVALLGTLGGCTVLATVRVYICRSSSAGCILHSL